MCEAVSTLKGIRISMVDLEKAVAARFVQAGVLAEQAVLTAKLLVQAEAEGRHTHGLVWLPTYLSGILQGTINPRPQISIERNGPAKTIVKGDFGLGYGAAIEAADAASESASEFGVGLAVLQQSGHVGVLSHYVGRAADRGYAAFACANGSPAISTPGGKRSILGTNPIAAAVPADPAPLIVDLSAASISRGGLLHARLAGKSIPFGTVLDTQGNEITDPEQALRGVVAPFAEGKGFALAVLVELIAGIAGSALLSSQIAFFDNNPQRLEYAFLIVVFRLEEENHALAQVLKSDLLAAGARVPGLQKYEARVLAEKNGLELNAAALKALQQAGISLP